LLLCTIILCFLLVKNERNALESEKLIHQNHIAQEEERLKNVGEKKILDLINLGLFFYFLFFTTISLLEEKTMKKLENVKKEQDEQIEKQKKLIEDNRVILFLMLFLFLFL
jgi:hypothetical protein